MMSLSGSNAISNETAPLIITDCKLCNLTGKGKVRALAKISLNDQLVISGIRLVDVGTDLIIAYPDGANEGTDAFSNHFRPQNSKLHDAIEERIINEYLNLLGN